MKNIKYLLLYGFIVFLYISSSLYILLNQMFYKVGLNKIISLFFIFSIIGYIFVSILLFQYWKIVTMKYYSKNKIIIFYIECIAVIMFSIFNLILNI